jgi:four helix bundle protein
MSSYQKLRVYQQAKQFVDWRIVFVEQLPRKVSATDHLERSSESVVLNIAHASDVWGIKERIHYIGHANGSALECAAAMDVLHAKKLVSHQQVYPGKKMLSGMVGMLVSWKTQTDNRVCEDRGQYEVFQTSPLFKHEQLPVYQAALQLAGWIEETRDDQTCSTDLIRKIDKSTTSIVLNIAEGNGRFHVAEQIAFLDIALKATSQSVALIDLAFGTRGGAKSLNEAAQQNLISIKRMLCGWKKFLREKTDSGDA